LNCKSNQTSSSAFEESGQAVLQKERKMPHVFQRAKAVGKQRNEDLSSSMHMKRRYDLRSVKESRCCLSPCCRLCTSAIESSISERVQELLTGSDQQPETIFILRGRLTCLPLTETSYRLLKHQFRIVTDYLTEEHFSPTANRWSAIFHLRLILARIRAARVSAANFADDCEETPVSDSGSSCCSATQVTVPQLSSVQPKSVSLVAEQRKLPGSEMSSCCSQPEGSHRFRY
jgi:hypothetical protein